MVEEVKAWKAGDGSVHASREAAVKCDVAARLGSTRIFNQGTILAVMEHAALLVDVLEPLADLQRDATVAEVGSNA